MDKCRPRQAENLCLFPDKIGYGAWRRDIDKETATWFAIYPDKREPRAAGGITRGKRCETMSELLPEYHLTAVGSTFRGIDLYGGGFPLLGTVHN